MDVDEQIRQVLLESLAPVDDMPTARREVSRRAATVQWQRRLQRTAALVAAAAASVAVVAALVWAAQPSSDSPPVVAPLPSGPQTPTPSPSVDVGSATVCGSLRVSEEVDSFLDSWTTGGSSLVEDHCVLPGRHGPSPQFDTSSLGPEQRLLVGDLPADFDVTQRRPVADGYPLVHLGRIEDTEHQMFLEWRVEGLDPLVACVEGSCAPDHLPTSRPGVIGIGRGSGPTGSVLTMTVWVEPEAAAVALEIDGEPVLWQRPVALTAHLFVDGYLPNPDATFEVSVLDQHGDTIATHEGDIDP